MNAILIPENGNRTPADILEDEGEFVTANWKFSPNKYMKWQSEVTLMQLAMQRSIEPEKKRRRLTGKGKASVAIQQAVACADPTSTVLRRPAMLDAFLELLTNNRFRLGTCTFHDLNFRRCNLTTPDELLATHALPYLTAVPCHCASISIRMLV